MGDSQQQLQSQAAKGARVGRCGFGDGKGVGDTARGRASRLRRSLAGDSRSLAGDDDDDPRAGRRGPKTEAQNVAPAEESVSRSMKPTAAESAEDGQRGVDCQENLTSPSENVAALPRKAFSLELKQCGGSNHGVSCGQSERCLRNPRASDDGAEDEVLAKMRSDTDDSGVCPRRMFSLDENIVSLMDSPKKTSSLMSNLRQREGRKVVTSAAESLGESKSCSPAMWRVNASEFEDKGMKTLSWTRSEDYRDREGEGRAGESRREKRHFTGSSTGIPELIEAFLDDGEIASSEEDDGVVGDAKARATIEGTGSDVETVEDEAASLRQKQRDLQEQPSSQCLTPSLQSTCDVSSWSLCHYHSLPQWMQDNEFILSCHRPPLPSFFACFKSIFRLHTETLNIWTHLLGCVAFVAMGAYFLALPRETVWLQEKLAFGAFFGGGAACFALSSAYHTLWCHSPAVGRLFSKLDYCGIALLIMGSFVPWLYYAFYCRGRLLLAYLALVAALGALSVLVSLWGRFGEPRFRPLRAGVFLAYGLSGIVPALHFAAAEGWRRAVAQASLHWLALMGALYVLGACVYALRVPERFFPGRCDLLFQSHQIFHVFVIAAALVHYHGLTEMAVYRLSFTDCASRALA